MKYTKLSVWHIGGEKRDLFKCWLRLLQKYGFESLLNKFKVTTINIKTEYTPYQISEEEKANTTLTIKNMKWKWNEKI